MSSGGTIMVTARSQNGVDVTITLPTGEIGKIWVELPGPFAPGQVLTGSDRHAAIERAKAFAKRVLEDAA